MKKTYLHRPNLRVTADFSDEDTPIFRYRLEALKDGASRDPRTVCAIMQNPSYASVDIADKSVQVLERVVFEKGLVEFNGIERLIIVNQFAFIQTQDFIGTDDKIGERNDEAIERAVNDSEIILIAWGKGNDFIQRQDQILEIVRAKKEKTIFKTSRHPSRVIYEGFIQSFHI